MKKLLLILALIFIATLAQAAQIPMTWDAPTTNADDTPISNFEGRYTLYYGLTEGAKTYTYPVVDTSGTVTILFAGLSSEAPLYFHVTATNTLELESADSNIVAKTPKRVLYPWRISH